MNDSPLASVFGRLADQWDIDPAATRNRWATPGELAKAISPQTIQTPALDIVDQALVQAFTERGSRLLISMPPQEGKTERSTKTGSLWALIRDPERRIGIVSYAQSLAETFGREIRNWIQTYDGTDGTLDLGLRIAPDNGAAARWQLDGHRGGLVAAGIGSALTGRALECLVVDDPFSGRDQAESAAYRDRVWDWWQAVGSTRLAPGAPVIVVLTRWHESDLAGRLLAAEDGHRWRVINIPALADHDPEKGQTDPLGRQPGEWLQSARGRTVAEWEQIRLQAGSRVFTSLYQGRPSPDQGDVWKRKWWRRYSTPLWSQHPADPSAWLVPECDQLIQSWDMAFKDTDGSDYVVGQVWARRGPQVYLVDQVHRRLSFTETAAAFAGMCAKWPQARARYVEDKANGTAIIDLLRQKIGGIVPVTPTESKYARASAVSPFLEAGNVHLPSPEIALFDPQGLIDESAAFPNAPHDDLVDATSQALAAMLLDGSGAEAWIAYLKRLIDKQEAAENEPELSDSPRLAIEAPQSVPEHAAITAPVPAEHRHRGPLPEPDQPVTADPAAARKAARDAMFREQQGPLERSLTGHW